MLTTDDAKFGNGALLPGEDEDNRQWLEIVNENGGRAILPFDGILPADAYLWSSFRGDAALLKRLEEMTDAQFIRNKLPLGSVGTMTIIKNTRLIRNVKIGGHCTVSGANKLSNLTIRSAENESTFIGEDVEIENGIIGFQNKIVYGVKALGVVTGRNVHLEYGARVMNMFISDNSTIACCEVLSNLTFPFHEQHHNNSFLIATMVQGQSNIAAGATIGSNHNSRAADGEILARRGFWPGLSSSFKHNSYFATFTLVAKGMYYAEMNITLPFTLISPGADAATIQIFPGFWFKYNMYALARNSWKFHKRDKRLRKEQHIESDFLAPDTTEEMLAGMEVLRKAISEALGREMTCREIMDEPALDKKLSLHLDGFLNKGKALILKPAQGVTLYHQMLHFYAARELSSALNELLRTHSFAGALNAVKDSYSEVEHQWENFGGQLIPQSSARQIIEDIKSGQIASWKDLHLRYDRLWQEYPAQKLNHALSVLSRLYQIDIAELDTAFIKSFLQEAVSIAGQLLQWAFQSREKDYTGAFRLITFRNKEELEAVVGKIEDNSFLTEYRKTIEAFKAEVEKIIHK
jgi:acetyltransferase-like isoleucine patch superfamily enzyme